MNQREMILKWMTEYGSITPVDAMREFGCMRLASRISEIRKDGYDVRKVLEKNVNRFGDTMRYARYSLGEKE